MEQYNRVQEELKSKTIELNRTRDESADREVNLKLEVEGLRVERKGTEEKF